MLQIPAGPVAGDEKTAARAGLVWGGKREIMRLAESCKCQDDQLTKDWGKDMAFPPPPDSKGAIRRAGRAISEGRQTQEDLEILDQWRGAHGYALNTFQANFRNRISRQSIPIEFVQRLKRRNTIIDKLRREGPDGRPLIRDLVGMHDLAGCRLIFDSIAELREFRSQLHSGFGEHLRKNPTEK